MPEEKEVVEAPKYSHTGYEIDWKDIEDQLKKLSIPSLKRRLNEIDSELKYLNNSKSVAEYRRSVIEKIIERQLKEE